MDKPTITLDFETYWSTAYTLSKMPTINYITDPQFQAQCVSILCPVLGINEPTCFYGAQIPVLMGKLKPLAHNLCLVGQNSVSFDALICLIHYGVKFGSHADTKLLGRFAFGSTQKLFSLEKLADRLGLRSPDSYRAEVARLLNIPLAEMTDNKLGQALSATKGMVLAQMDKNLLLALGTYCNSDVWLTAKIYQQLRPCITPAAWMSMQHNASALLDMPLVLDVPRLKAVNEDYVGQRTLELEAFAEVVGLAVPTVKGIPAGVADTMLKIVRSKPRFAGLLGLLGVPEHDLPTKEGKNGVIYAFSKTDPALVELQAEYEDGDSLVPEAIRLRLEYMSSMMEKRTEKFIRAGGAFTDNRWSMHIETFGAVNTARHSGGNAFGGSPHNLSRSKPTLHTSCGTDIRWAEDVGIRDCIMAPEGRTLLVYDSSGVELRCVGFIAQEKSITDALTDKSRDLYCEFGSAVFGRTITKSDKALRNAAKAGVLSLQYLTGAKRLHLAFLQWKLPLGIDVAKQAHRVYRETKPGVVAFWAFAERLLSHWAGVGEFPTADPNVVWRDGSPRLAGCDAVRIIQNGFIMPNGFRLIYPEMQYRMGRGIGSGFSYYNANKFSRQRIHPGLLLENVSQAITTQVIDWQQQMISDGCKGEAVFCGSVHDELLYHCAPEAVQRVSETIQKWMRRSPPWWQAAIFNCEGGDGLCLIEGDAVPRQRYGAAK